MIPNTGISGHCVSILDEDTICAVSTPPGVGGIAVIRVSGKKAMPVTDMIFRPKGKGGNLSHRSSHTLAYGEIYDGAGEGSFHPFLRLFQYSTGYF